LLVSYMPLAEPKSRAEQQTIPLPLRELHLL
jgi:hypothetical protein